MARAVGAGIAVEDSAKLTEKRILGLLRDLDDGDLLLLAAFGARPEEKAESFNRLRPPDYHSIDHELYEASMSKLERLSLLRKVALVDHETGLPEFEKFTGETKGWHNITPLGTALLSRVGLDGASAYGHPG